MRIGLVLDNPKRELYGYLLVTEELVNAGHEVYIIPMYEQGLDIPLLGLDAIVVNYVRSANKELLIAYRRLGMHIFVLDAEGGVLSEQGSNAPDKWAMSMRESGLMDLVDDYLFWGQNVYEAFRQHSGKDPLRLHLTGNPRFDFYGSQWRPLLTYPIADYVLINTNFSAINPLFNRSDKEELEVLVAAGWERAYIAPVFADLKVVFQKYLDTLIWLVERNPEITFVIRPHPFEREENYRKLFSGYSNVIVDNAGNVLNVIAHARCVLHLNCGTAIETCLVGKLPVSMEFLNTERLLRHTPLPSRVSLPVHSREQLDELVRDARSFWVRYDNNAMYERYIEPWFYKRDGEAHLRVTRVIQNALQRIDKKKHFPDYQSSMRGCRSKPRLAQRLQGVMACILGSRTISIFRRFLNSVRSEKYIEIEDIQEKLSKISGIKGRTANYSVRPAYHPFHRVALASVSITRSA